MRLPASDFLLASAIPENDGSINIRRGQPTTIGRKHYAGHNVVMPLEVGLVYPIFGLPEFDGAIVSPRGDRGTVRGDGDSGDSFAMRLRNAIALLTRSRPDSQTFIPTNTR